MGELPSRVAELESELGPWPFALRVDIYMCHSSVCTGGVVTGGTPYSGFGCGASVCLFISTRD